MVCSGEMMLCSALISWMQMASQVRPLGSCCLPHAAARYVSLGTPAAAGSVIAGVESDDPYSYFYSYCNLLSSKRGQASAGVQGRSDEGNLAGMHDQ